MRELSGLGDVGRDRLKCGNPMGFRWVEKTLIVHVNIIGFIISLGARYKHEQPEEICALFVGRSRH